MLVREEEERVASHDLMLDWLHSIHGPNEKFWSEKARLNASDCYRELGFVRMEMGQADEALKQNI
eukprot:2172220-Amphidinium_carterae.1